MTARRDLHEAERERLFPEWRAVLEAAGGNVTRAAIARFPDVECKVARDRGNRLTKRLGLVKYARALRVAATGRAMGPGDRKSNE